MKNKKRTIQKKAIGLAIGLFIMFLPFMGLMGIRYLSGRYAVNRSVIIEDCKVMAVIEAPKETLLAVMLPQEADTFVSEPRLYVVRAYRRRDKEKPTISEGDTVTCGFPERDTMRKGYVIKNS